MSESSPSIAKIRSMTPDSSGVLPSMPSTNALASAVSAASVRRQWSNEPVDSMHATANRLTSPSVVRCLRMLDSWMFDGFERMLWMMGNENLPSVRSSPNPLFLL